MNRKHADALICLLLQLMLCSGCTSMLWDDDKFARLHQPARPANLRLFYSERQDDLLAQYDEVRVGHKKTHRRQYWVQQNDPLTNSGRKPEFVQLHVGSEFVTVPVVDTNAGPLTPTFAGRHALLSTNGYSFDLYDGLKYESHDLPRYYAGRFQKPMQVALTPVAVAIDATVVGAIVAAVIEYYTGLPFSGGGSPGGKN